jgi:hypothetical protein
MKIKLKIKIHKVMKKLLLIIGLCAAVFQIHAQSGPSRIEKKNSPISAKYISNIHSVI